MSNFSLSRGICLCLLFISPLIGKAQTVTVTGSLQTGRVLHRSHLLSNGKLLVFGGDNDNLGSPEVYASAELYDPASQTWSYTGSMKATRTAFASVVLNDGRVLAIGGMNTTNYKASCELYDPSTGTWDYTDSLHSSSVFHSAVKLSDGKVLVAGKSGEKTSELYDPATNTWRQVGQMNLYHGDGIAMIVLDNGKVLATGGSQTPTKAELYDPVSEQWTLLSNNMVRAHSHHSIIRLKTGKYLIAGTLTSLSTTDMLYTELYDATASSFTATGNMVSYVARAPLVLLDDGKVLVYNSGDIQTPLNSKCIQIYNPTTGTWSSGSYNFLGGNAASVNMLPNGMVLLSGGSYAVGTGGERNAYLVSQDVYTACVPPNTDLLVDGGVGCNVVPVQVKFPIVEIGTTYELFVGDRPTGNPATATGTTLTIPAFKNLTKGGMNVINVKVSKPGCPAYVLKDTAHVIANLPAIARPVITANGPTIVCAGGNVTLSAPSGMSGYLWVPGSTGGQTLFVNTSGYYRVMVRDAAGCYTDYSDPVQVTVAPSILDAGSDEIVCRDKAPYQLTGMSAESGIWSGSGVSPTGLFNPSVAGAGNITLTYSMCSKTDTKVITVVAPGVPNFTPQATYEGDTVCSYSSSIIKIYDAAYPVRYEFWYEGNLVATKFRDSEGVQFSTIGIGKPTTYMIKGILTNACGSDTLIKYYTIYPYVDPSLGIGTKTPDLCRNETGYIYVLHSQTNVTYQLTRGNKNIGTPLRGNGDTLFLSTGVLNETGVYKVTGTHRNLWCITTLLQQVKITVTGPRAYFTISSYNAELGDAVKITNRSVNPGGVYNWTFGAGAGVTSSTDQSPTDLLYTSTGNRKLKLMCTLPNGCIDTISKHVNIIEPFTPASCDYSVSSGSYMLASTAVCFDKEDNHFQLFQTSGRNNYHYGPHGDSLFFKLQSSAYNEVMTLVKYNPKGMIQWATYIRNDLDNIPGSMVTDSLGNVYYNFFRVGGNYTDSIEAYSTDGSYTRFARPVGFNDGSYIQPIVIVKYDKDGILQWQTGYSDVLFSPHTTMTLDKELNLYVSGEYWLAKFDRNGVLQWKTDLAGHIDIEVDSKGYIWGLRRDNFIVDQYDSNGNLIFSKPEPIATRDNTHLTPFNLELDEQDNLYMFVTYNGGFIWNQDTVVVGSPPGYNDFDAFLCKMKTTGEREWLKPLQTSNAYRIYPKGMDYKNGKLIFTAMTELTQVKYNKQGSVYHDAIDFTQAGNFIGLMDTTAAGPIKLVKVNDNVVSSFNSPYDLISFSKNTDQILFSTVKTNSTLFGLTIVTKPLVASPTNPVDNVLLTLDRDCIFTETVPVSSFVVTQAACKENNVQFYDASSTGTETWDWTFEGGTPATSSQPNPVVRFDTPGAHTVTLTASSTIGTGNAFSNAIQVGEPSDLTVTPDVACIGGDVLLSASGAVSYVWNNTTAGSTFTLNDVTEDVTVTVKGTNAAGCSSTVQHTVMAEICTGITGEENNAAVSVYPNPCADYFYVNANILKSSTYDILLYNMEGKVVREQSNNSSDQKSMIRVDTLSPGIYHLMISNEQGIQLEQNIAVIRN
ncbi:MAG: C-terminal target protein [Chitinophagaceae bacterium]|nr:C-terminal target protein [Chitinophagaceae bacterium]